MLSRKDRRSSRPRSTASPGRCTTIPSSGSTRPAKRSCGSRWKSRSMSGLRSDRTRSRTERWMEQERSSVAQNDAIDAALDRSDLYRWLSLAFRYPDADPAAHLQTPALTALETMLERIASEERDALR